MKPPQGASSNNQFLVTLETEDGSLKIAIMFFVQTTTCGTLWFNFLFFFFQLDVSFLYFDHET